MVWCQSPRGSGCHLVDPSRQTFRNPFVSGPANPSRCEAVAQPAHNERRAGPKARPSERSRLLLERVCVYQSPLDGQAPLPTATHVRVATPLASVIVNLFAPPLALESTTSV